MLDVIDCAFTHMAVRCWLRSAEAQRVGPLEQSPDALADKHASGLFRCIAQRFIRRINPTMLSPSR